MIFGNLEQANQWLMYQDANILVVNKPPGLLTIQDGYDTSLPTVKGILEPNNGKLWIVHRLDKDTSGVLLIARNARMHRLLNLQFQDRKIKKTYHAIIHGQPNWSSMDCTMPLKVNGDRKHRTTIDLEKGKPASTTFILKEPYSGYSLIEALPHSGYTHQIRAHLAWIGHPIAADVLYLGGSFTPRVPPNLTRLAIDFPTGLSRVGLHASKIHLAPFEEDLPEFFFAPYPDDFSSAISQLKTSAAT